MAKNEKLFYKKLKWLLVPTLERSLHKLGENASKLQKYCKKGVGQWSKAPHE